jgi:GDPmannose 4,6-dehydratase/GDP-4-dehydro-6-deoxy-D-mannose reductase
LHCSTSEVYGKVAESDLPITEKQPFSPSSPYSVSKIYQDYLCDVYSNSFGLNIIKTRMFTYINPKRSDLFASSFAKQIAEIELGQRGILRHGNLDSIRTILDVRDAMDAYIACAEMCEIGDVYNIGGDTVVTVGDVLQKLISYAKKNIETEIDQNLLRPIDVTLQVPNDKKFRKITGWTPRYTLDETLLELLDFWRAKVRAIEN